MDAQYSENAGAIFRVCQGSRSLKSEANSLKQNAGAMCMDAQYSENAGAVFDAGYGMGA